MVESVRRDINKYLKRERKKTLPEGADFWDFDCRFGTGEEEARGVHLAEIGKCIDKAQAQQLPSFYLEILAKPGYRSKKSVLWKSPAAQAAVIWGIADEHL